jgi:anti-sigma factor RsiW
MTPLLTCRQFFEELTDYLDDKLDAQLRLKLEQHLSDCPNCWVICDTTKKTIKVYKGMEPCTIPPEIHTRLMAALEKKAKKNP